MKKLLKVLVVLVVLLVVGVVIVYFSLNGIVRTGVKTAAREATGVPVELAEVDFSPFAGEVSMKGFLLGNPRGYKSSHAASFRDIQVKMAPSAVLEDTVVIDEVVVDALSVIYERSTGSSNIEQIQDHIGRYASTAEEERQKDEAGEPRKRIKIKRLVITNASVAVAATFLKDRPATLPLPPIELHDVGGEKGGTVGEIARAIADPIVTAVDAVMGTIDRILSGGLEGLQNIGAGVKGLQKISEKALENIQGGQDVKKSLEGVKGLLER